MASETNPPIAALHYPRAEASYLAMEKLLQLMRDDGAPVQSEELEAQFIRRRSLGKD